MEDKPQNRHDHGQADTQERDDTARNTQPAQGRTRRRRATQYIPAYRSAAYAIIKVLSQHAPAHKQLIAYRAPQHTDISFDTRHRFSGFTALKDLLRRGVVRETERKRYALTPAGLEISRLLFQDQPSETEADPDTVHLVIDSREKQNQSNTAYFQVAFSKLFIPTATRYLGLGDFVWIRNENILDCIVERKAGTDFASSIADGRFREQKRRLRMLGMRTFYIVEDMRVTAQNERLAAHCLVEAKLEEMVVIETESIAQTVQVLAGIDSRVRAGEQNERMTYGTFIEEGSKFLDAGGLFACALSGVRGLSHERAAALAREFGTLAQFHAAMAAAGNFAHALAQFEVQGRPIGRRLAESIIAMLQ